MTIEEASIQFLENQISTNYKEIFDKYLIDSIEWHEMDGGLRPIASLVDLEYRKPSNIIVLFPVFNLPKK